LIALEGKTNAADKATPQENLKRELEIDRLEFFKRDAASRARMTLRLALTDEQAGAVADLDRAW
jgi:hypothetical protein